MTTIARKSEMVRNLAHKLRQEGTPEDMISPTLIKDLRGYIDKDTIRDALAGMVRE